MIYDPSLSHFDIDMRRGSQAELFVSDICQMLAGGNGSIEVKRDAWYPVSGRFYIECECMGRDGIWRPSGIAVTKATFWGLVWGGHPSMTILATDWLKRALDEARKNKRNLASCDYGENPTRGVFVYETHLRKTRDVKLDEHQKRGVAA